MLRSLLATAPLVALASAFSDTYPVVAWSSHKTSVLDRLPAAPAALGELFTHMLTHDDICSYDAVVLVEQPGLHASDLRTLSPSSGFVTQLSSSPKSVQRPYVRRSSSASDNGLHDLAHLVTQRCAGRLASVVPGESDLVLEPKTKHVVNVYLPELEGTIAERKAKAAEGANALLQELPKIAASLPKYLVILTGAPPSTHNAKRQLTITSISDDPLQAQADTPVLQQHPIPSSFSADAPEGGILARYQLLTPALITSLLIALFVFLPMLVFAVSALASIQSPLRVEAPKGYSADGKKNQ